MGNSTSKPTNKTGKSIVRQKIEAASKTGVLSLQDHGLQVIPVEVLSMTNIRTLDLSKNKLKQLPQKLTTLINLKSLKVEGNQIFHGGVSPVSKLENLQVLSLSNNSLGKPKKTNAPGKKGATAKSGATNLSLPANTPSVPPLPSTLKQLKLDSNHFSSIPPSICSPNLTKLFKLDFSNNNLATIPVEISNLVALAELNLDNNMIVSLPDAMGQLKKLKALSLKNNQIQVTSSTSTFSDKNPQPLPAVLFSETPLIDLNLGGNKMTNTQLNEFEGFSAFLERRQQVKSKNIYGGALTDLGVCGLE